MTNKRYNFRVIPALTWRQWWKLLWIKTFSEYEEVKEFLPCGCRNPEYDKATFEEILIPGGKRPFTMFLNGLSPENDASRATSNPGKCPSDGTGL